MRASFPTSIVFTTHNRRELLEKAIRAARKQTVPVDIIVMDDASTDGTPEMMASTFPDVEYHRTDESRGPCYQRTQGVRHASSDVVILLDDDSVMPSRHTVEQTLANFEEDRIGAVAMPFINVRRDDIVRTRAPDEDRIYAGHAFVAAAHAVRREVFLEAGGFREFFFYMEEERDLCVRMLDKGYYVRLGTADPVHHMQPPERGSDGYGRRNHALFHFCNTPRPQVIGFLAGTSIKGLIYGLRIGAPKPIWMGVARGFAAIWTYWDERDPVSRESFRLYRFLKTNEPVSLSTIENHADSVHLGV